MLMLAKIITFVCVLSCFVNHAFAQTSDGSLETAKTAKPVTNHSDHITTPELSFTVTVADVNSTVDLNITATSVSSLNVSDHHNDSIKVTTPSGLDLTTTDSLPTTSLDDANTTGHCPGGHRKLAVLPGQGWDNLESVSRRHIFKTNYLTCTMTSDGSLLIPDGMFSSPMFETTIDPSAEVYKTWDEYYPISAKSVTKAVSYPDYASISSSFSEDYQRVKKAQVTDHAVTVRAKLERKLYEIVFYHEKVPITDDFHDAVMQLAEAVYNDDGSLMDYYADSLIEEYGTHLVNGIIAGGMVVMEESVKPDFLDVSEVFDYSKLAAVVKLNFLQKFNLTDGKEIVDPEVKQDLEKYHNSTTYSQAKIYGGAPEIPFSFNQWQKTVSSNPSINDRTGIFIDEIITESNFPFVPPPFVPHIKAEVKNAIERYYIRNTHRGCTEKEAVNFAFVANKEDGTCQVPSTNYTFGGMYQECKQSSMALGDFCHDLGLEQSNPLTGKKSCPKGYADVYLHTKMLFRDNCSPDCFKDDECAKKCTRQKFRFVTITYTTYWCASLDETPQDSGYLFGGLYSSKAVNMVTGRFDCPASFSDIRFGLDVHVCVSTPTSLEVQDNAIPFGGFFSCLEGNPLALPLDQRHGSQSKQWPFFCPQDYSQQFATVEGTCPISYCVSASHVNTTFLPLIKPPYSDKPNATNMHTIVSVDQSTGTIWYRTNITAPWMKATTEEDLINAGLEGLAALLMPKIETTKSPNTETTPYYNASSVSLTTEKMPSDNSTSNNVTPERPLTSEKSESETATPQGMTSENDTSKSGLIDTSTAVDATTGNTSNGITDEHDDGKKDKGLSGGIIAAIVIVATLGTLAVVGLGGYAYKKRQEQRQRSGSNAPLARNDSVQQERDVAEEQQPHQDPTPEESFDSPA